MKNNKLIWAIIGIQLTALAIIGLAIYYTDYYLTPALEFTDQPFPVTKSEFKQGEKLMIESSLCRYTNIPSIIYPQLVNGMVQTLAPIPRPGKALPKGQTSECYTIITPALVIPLDYPPGDNIKMTGKLEIIIPTPFGDKARITSFESESFRVVSK